MIVIIASVHGIVLFPEWFKQLKRGVFEKIYGKW